MPLCKLRIRIVRAGLLAIFLMFGLAGCFALEGQPNGLISIRGSEHGFKVTVCRDLQVDHIFVQYSQASAEPVLADVAWNRVVSAGETFTSQEGEPNSLPLADQSPSIEPGGWLVVELTSNSTKKPESAVGDFDIPATGLPRYGWLHQDGSVNEQACSTSDAPN